MNITERFRQRFGIETPDGVEYHLFGDPYGELGRYPEYAEIREESGLDFDEKGLTEIEADGAVIFAYIEQDELSYTTDFWECYDEGTFYGPFETQEEADEAMEKVKDLDTPWFLVDHYDHSGDHFSIQSSRWYPDRQWDVRTDAIYVPSAAMLEEYEILKETKSEAEAKNWLLGAGNEALHRFSVFCNGGVYCAVAERWDIKDNTASRACYESCSMTVGVDEAVNMLKQMIFEVSPDDSPSDEADAGAAPVAA